MARQRYPLRRHLHFLVPAAIFLGVILLLSLRWGPVPPLGPFLSLSEGVFAQYKKEAPHSFVLKLPALSEPVDVVVDEHLVPHIFAKNKRDLYFAQGFVTAKFRLWQMDMTTRVAGGRLSEVLGVRAKNIDAFFLSLGLKKASKDALELMEKDEATALAVDSYTNGVNAYIKDLKYADWPVEYKAVHFRPQPFEKIRVAQLIKIMSFNLSGRSYDLAFTEVLQQLGWKKAIDLFPDNFGKFDGRNLDDFFLDPKGRASNDHLLSRAPFISEFKKFPEFLLPFQNDGSNSWVVGGARSKSKNVILSNDTHLGLKAPPVWFENRLHIEGELDVYGSSFPGAPGVVLGFNSDFAWGATNGTIDVLDWFEVEFKDDSSHQYLLDGKWVEAKSWQESYVVRGEKALATKQMIWTEFGPVLHREGKLGLAVRWTALEPSNELAVFLKLNENKSVDSAVRLFKDYKNPIQNFSLAEGKNFALVVAGIVPIRDPGFGRSIEDGRISRNNWRGYLDYAENPKSINPPEHFLESANQRPVGSDFKANLGWDFEEPFRGLRIRDHLDEESGFDPDKSMKMQNEAFNKLAHLFFKVVDRNKLSHELNPEILEWDFLDLANSPSTTLFYAWFRGIENELWGESLKFQEKRFFPKKSRTLVELQALKNANESAFYTLLIKTFKEAKAKPDSMKIWGEAHPTRIAHVTTFPGLDAGIFTPNGSHYSLNSNKGNHGGAWRLVVEMSNPPQAWTQIPGSNDGDPLGPNFSKNVPEWVEGKFKRVGLLKKSEIQRVKE